MKKHIVILTLLPFAVVFEAILGALKFVVFTWIELSQHYDKIHKK